MKQAFLLLVGLGWSMIGWAQIVDGKNLATDTSVQYLEMVGTYGTFDRQLVVSVDYGQAVYVGTNTRVEGADGRVIKFNSIMDALNRFNGWGWELTFIYNVGGGDGTVFRYVMRRQVK